VGENGKTADFFEMASIERKMGDFSYHEVKER
jgi:hypothetical protein